MFRCYGRVLKWKAAHVHPLNSAYTGVTSSAVTVARAELTPFSRNVGGAKEGGSVCCNSAVTRSAPPLTAVFVKVSLYNL